MQSWKSTTDFTILERLADNDRFHNVTRKVKKKAPADPAEAGKQKYQNIWYMKKSEDVSHALREVITQELFRLYISSQPKTRLVMGKDFRSENVISKEIIGGVSLEDIPKGPLHIALNNHLCHGLGAAQVMALVVNEIDLKLSNLFKDTNNIILKIDGDRCFVHMDPEWRHDGNYKITAKLIDSLPYVTDYYACNWLDDVEWDGFAPGKNTSVVLDKNMVSNPGMRAEINRTMLKVIVTPNELIRQFVESYISGELRTNDFYEEIVARKEQLKDAAMQNESFRKYVQTKFALDDLNSFITRLKEFRTTGKRGLNVEEHTLNMRAGLNMLRIAVNAKEKVTDNASTLFSIPVRKGENQQPLKRTVRLTNR